MASGLMEEMGCSFICGCSRPFFIDFKQSSGHETVCNSVITHGVTKWNFRFLYSQDSWTIVKLILIRISDVMDDQEPEYGCNWDNVKWYGTWPKR